MLGLPAEFMQMEGLLKLDQESFIKEGMNVVASFTVKTTSDIGRCQNCFDQNGYPSASAPCEDCLKLADEFGDESLKTTCSVCSLEECSCQLFQCAYCTDSFPTTLLLQKHTFVHCAEAASLNSSTDEPSPVDNQNEKVCPLCRKHFPMFDFARHACTARYTCHLCGSGLSSAYNLKIHIMKHAGGDLPYRCDICTKTFIKPSELSRHLRVHSGAKPRQGVKCYPCDTCSKIFTRPADLRRHSLTHTGARPFACSVCGLAFSDTSNLKKHTTIHRKEDSQFVDVKTYHCSFCNKMFSRPSELKRHFTAHTKTKPFSCEFCGLAFGDASNLHKHVLGHAKMGLRECIVCQATFDSFEKLESHVANHPSRLADETIECVKCDICGKIFSSELYLSGHRAGHTEARPFPCTECQKTFKSLSHLKNHMLIHNGSKGHICAVCGKAFLTKSSLRRHEAIHSRPANSLPNYLTPPGSHNALQGIEHHKTTAGPPTWSEFCELKPQLLDQTSIEGLELASTQIVTTLNAT